MPDLDRLVGGLRCRDVLALLPEFVDGGLSDDVLGRVRRHLNGCDTCEKFGGEYAELVSLLRTGRPQAPLRPGVHARLADRMDRFWVGEEG